MASGALRGVAILAALCACGLVDPSAPPARVLHTVPGLPGAPLPIAGRLDAEGPSPPFPGWTLTWHDEFEGTALDESTWTIDVGPWRAAVNSRDSVEVGGGLLSLVTFTDAGVNHAAHLNTTGKLEAVYGYFEARARFLDSAGQWCSFFLWPTTMANPLGDPGTAGVEIDVFEHRDTSGDGFDLSDMVYVGLNWDMVGGTWERDHQLLAHPLGEPLHDAWHSYAVLWTESGTTFYVDDIPVWRSSAAVSHRTEPVYVTCEVDDLGDYAGPVPAGGYGSRETSTTGMQVDWVRVWQAPP